MPRRFKTAIFAVGIIFVLAFGVAPVHASFDATVAGTATKQAGGEFLYSYKVSVLSSSTSSLTEFNLNLTSGVASGIFTPGGAPLSSITAPAGFLTLYTTGDPTITFSSSSPSTDIAPGSSGLFSFTSLFSPVSQPFLLRSFDASGGVLQLSGSVVGPVPEPTSLVLLGIGGLGFLGLSARGLRRKSAPSSC
ncbi:MAG: hypothetical protein NVSMB9_16370 [Isosphaeraceae bacterium]